MGVRGPDGPLPGQAEFPGGKCEPGESAENCAVRECQEETGLGVVVVGLIDEFTWTYPHGTVKLSFLLCKPRQAMDVRNEQQGFRWEAPAALMEMPFPEANRGVLERLLTLV